MNNKFDELAKGLARSVTRRQALKRFGAGLAGMALACLGLANMAQAGGTYLCCIYECYTSIYGGKLVRSKLCVQPGGGCPAPSSFCSLTSYRFISSCKNCT